MEWRRVYQRRLVLLFCGILVLNMVLYLRDQSETVELIAEEVVVDGVEEDETDTEGCSNDEAYRAYNQLLEQVQSMGLQSTADYYASYSELTAYAKPLGNGARFALAHLLEQITLQENYQGAMKSIRSSAGKQSNISIFNKDQSFSVANRERTLQDFEQTEGISWELTPTYGVESVLSQNNTIYLLLLFMTVVVWQFGTERKLGLWGMIYQTAGGRGKLAWKRCVLLAGTALGAAVLCYGTLLLWALNRYEGWACLAQPMQCLSDFYRIPYPLTVWQLVLVQVAVTAGGLFLYAMLLWMCLTLCMNRTMAVLFGGLLLVVEYSFYTLIGMKSIWALLYHMNMFQWIFPYRWMSSYFNWGVGELVVPRYILIIGFGLVLGVALAVVQLQLNKNMHPVRNTGKLELFFTRVQEYWNRLVEGMPAFLKEVYKLLVWQKMWLFVLLVLYVAVDSKKVSGISYDLYDGNYQKDFYEQCTGPVDEDTTQWMAALAGTLEDLQSQQEQADQDYQDGIYTWGEYQNRLTFISDDERRQGKLYRLAQNQLQYLESLQQEQGIAGWVIDERGYEAFLGKGNDRNQLTLGLVSALAVLMAGAVLVAQEQQAGMNQMLNSTWGREHLRLKKYAVMALFTFVIWSCSYGYNLYNMLSVYHLGDFGAPVQSLRIFSDFPLHISVGGYMVLLYGMRFVLLLAFSWIAMFISARCSYYVSVLGALALLLPHLLCLLGITALKNASAVYMLAYIPLRRILGNGFALWWRYGVMVLLGIAAVLPENILKSFRLRGKKS